MSESEMDDFRIVKDAVEGKRQIDQRTIASAEALDERLQRLKKMDKIFDEVQFSSAVNKILTRDALSVG